MFPFASFDSAPIEMRSRTPVRYRLFLDELDRRHKGGHIFLFTSGVASNVLGCEPGF